MADMLVNQALPLSPGHPVTASLTACNISPRIPPLLRYKHAHGFAHVGQLHVSMLDMSRTLSSSSSSSPSSSAIASASSAKKSRKLSAVATLVAATSLSSLMISKELNASLLVTPSPSSSPSTSPRKSWKLFSSPAASSSSSSPSMISKENGGKGGREDIDDDRVTQIHTVREFDEALVKAKSNLVVVEYAASHSVNSRRIYPAMVELSRTCQDVAFLLVMGDESAETKALCARAKVDRVPHFSFYKNGEIVHEETAGMLPETLIGDVLYYGGDADAPIQQLHGKQDVENLLQENIADGRLVVLDVGLKHCGPCVKVYPTFVKLAKQMKGSVIFARMNGDENTECMEFLRSMGVVEVPTFLFIRAGKVCGRYVGSGKGELIGEILRYQGVRVTY